MTALNCLRNDDDETRENILLKTQQVVTRFAPSPTGLLHLGGVRTALFNWLYSRHHGGKFLLRIEDTDQARNTPEALRSIQDGLVWMGLDADDATIYQSKLQQRHQAIAERLLELGKAYWCDLPNEKVTLLKEKARAQGRAPDYPARTHTQKNKPSEHAVLRFKMPRTGTIDFHDQVQGHIKVQADQLEDLVILRADGTPTYMLAVVVDDHDMGVTHVIRGTDHLSNTPKQICLYHALGWHLPIFAHLPLIHGPDGAKLSKRHGALDIRAYQAEGFLPNALFNALLRLGFSYQDKEHFSRAEAVKLFTFKGIGKAPARFDADKLRSLNGFWMRQKAPETLLQLLHPFWQESIGNLPDADAEKRLIQGLPALAERAKTLKELCVGGRLYVDVPVTTAMSAQKVLSEKAQDCLQIYRQQLFAVEGKAVCAFTPEGIESFTRKFADDTGMKLKDIAQPLRVALTGRLVSPPLFQVMAILGEKIVKKRLVF